MPADHVRSRPRHSSVFRRRRLYRDRTVSNVTASRSDLVVVESKRSPERTVEQLPRQRRYHPVAMSARAPYLMAAAVLVAAVVGESWAVTNEADDIIDAVNSDPDSTWEVKAVLREPCARRVYHRSGRISVFFHIFFFSPRRNPTRRVSCRRLVIDGTSVQRGIKAFYQL